MNNNIERGSFTPDHFSLWFWSVIEKAERNRDRLRFALQEMTRQELIRFDNEFQEAATQLVDDPFFEFMDENTSEDGAKDIADFVVSQGKEFYSEVWINPERIPATIDRGDASTFTGIAAQVFWDRFAESIPQEIG